MCEYRKVAAVLPSPSPPSVPSSPLLERLSPHLPLLSWLPSYSLSSLPQDLWAGLLLSSSALSSSLALSLLSRTPPHSALSSLAVHHTLWFLLSPHTHLSPSLSPLLCLLLAHASTSPFSLLVLTLLSGLLQLLASLVQPLSCLLLAPLPSYVTRAATTATVLLTTSYSCSLLLGTSSPSSPPSPLHTAWHSLFSSHHRISPLPATLGLSLLALLVILRRLPKFHWGEGPDPSSLSSRVLRTTKISLSSSRSLIALLLATTLATTWPSADLLPSFPLLPPTSWDWDSLLPSLPSLLSPTLLLLPTLPLALHSLTQEAPTLRRDFLLLGLGTLLSAPLGGLPLTTSRLSPQPATPLAHLITALLLLLFLPLLHLLLPLLPTPALAAVLLVHVAFDIELSPLLALWRHDRPQLAVYGATLLSCLFSSPSWGLSLGGLLSLLLLLHRTFSSPLLQQETPDCLRLLPSCSLLTEVQGEELLSCLLSSSSPRIELCLSRVNRLDPEVVVRLDRVAVLLRARGTLVVVTGATGQVAGIIRDTSLHVEVSEVTETV